MKGRPVVREIQDWNKADAWNDLRSTRKGVMGERVVGIAFLERMKIRVGIERGVFALARESRRSRLKCWDHQYWEFGSWVCHFLFF